MMEKRIFISILMAIAFEVNAKNTFEFYISDSTTGSSKQIFARFEFTTLAELTYDLSSVSDTFNTVVLNYDSVLYIPDDFFKLKRLKYISIIAPVIPSIDMRFSQLNNLQALEITCDTLLGISNKLAKLNNLCDIPMIVRHYYPPILDKTAQIIVRRSKCKSIKMAINDKIWAK